MKIKSYVLGLTFAVVALFSTFTVNAQQQPPLAGKWFSIVGATAVSNAASGITSWVGIVPVGQGVPIVELIQFSTDVGLPVQAGARFWDATGTNAQINISTNTASQAFAYVGSGQGTRFAANDITVIRYGVAGNQNTNAYRRAVVSSVTSTSITFTANTSFPLSAGDIIYRMQTNAVISAGGTANLSVGTNAVTINAGGGVVYAGQPLLPLMVEAVGNSNASLGVVSGSYRQ